MTPQESRIANLRIGIDSETTSDDNRILMQQKIADIEAEEAAKIAAEAAKKEAAAAEAAKKEAEAARKKKIAAANTDEEKDKKLTKYKIHREKRKTKQSTI